MEGDDDAVVRRMDVGLEIPIASLDRGGERGERVLRMVPRAAAMGERDRTRVVEERVSGPGRPDQPSQRILPPLRRFSASAEIASRAARFAIIAVDSAQS